MKKLFFLYVWLNLTHIAELRKENLVKHIRKRTIQTGRLFFSSSLTYINLNSPLWDEKIINATSSRRYFFFTRAKFDANNRLFKENLVKCKGKRTSHVVFIVFSSL